MTPTLSVVLPLLSVLLGALLTYILNVRTRRRTAEEDAYQAAIVAVAAAEASANYLSYQARPASFTDEQFQSMLDDNERRNYEIHIDKISAAQLALAQLVPYDPTMAPIYRSPEQIRNFPEPIIQRLTGRLRELQKPRRLRWGWPPIGR